MNAGLLIAIVVIVVLVVLLALYIWVSYTALVALGRRVDEAWADIVVQLRRRASVVPALTGAVQGYATHERALFAALGRARDETMSAANPVDASAAENHLQQALRSLLTVAETYPKLSSNPQFLGLQSELGETEDALQGSRRFYNGGVREFNTKIQVFPNALFAKRLGYAHRDFFEVADTAAVAAPPKVQF